ncbi:MAG TPA: hypothetical protein VFV66_19355 [Nonomuraea sp.]|nr:hypothetical protein [Nonomuraea sp.]
MLPRPLAILGALTIIAGTGAAVRILPAGGASPPPPRPAAQQAPAMSQAMAAESTTTFVGFVDTAASPGFDPPAAFRRTGVRHYLLGHLVAGGPDGCDPKWAAPPDQDTTPDSAEQATDDADALEPDTSPADPLEAGVGRGLDPGKNPVANKIGPLRAMGGDAAPAFGGPEGRDPAATCTDPDRLTAAYRRVVGAFDAAAIDFEVRDSDDGAVLRRARAIRAIQRERPLRVSFTLPLRPHGLDSGDVAMLRATHEAGAEVTTVNLLATMEPDPRGRLRRLADAVRLARDQIAHAYALPDPGQAWPRIGLTPVLKDKDHLDEPEARTLADYATRYGLAWLSLRGVPPSRGTSRILWDIAP